MAGKKQSRSGEEAKGVWGLEQIEKLIDVLINRQVTEFEMEQGGARIRVKRGECRTASAAGPEISTSAPAPVPPSAPASVVIPTPAATPSASVPSSSEKAAESTEGLHVVKSPIVGTFYAASAPDAPPFVKVGDVVRVGQVLCIIEAMKLMNELESEVAGEIVRSYVENGQAVEYGQSLFAIRPLQGK